MKISSVIMALGVAVGSTMGVVAVTGTPAFAASCPDNDHRNNDGKSGRLFNANAVNIRTGPSTSCTSIGQGQLTHSVVFHCSKSGWTFLKDVTTNRSGWVRNDLLDGRGSRHTCEAELPGCSAAPNAATQACPGSVAGTEAAKAVENPQQAAAPTG